MNRAEGRSPGKQNGIENNFAAGIKNQPTAVKLSADRGQL
jgi:hypothetical protein